MGLLLAMPVVLHVALSLRIAAFNIQTFGETKMSNATLSTYIVQVGPCQLVPKKPRGRSTLSGLGSTGLLGLGNTGSVVSPEGNQTQAFALSSPVSQGDRTLGTAWLTASGCKPN